MKLESFLENQLKPFLGQSAKFTLKLVKYCITGIVALIIMFVFAVGAVDLLTDDPDDHTNCEVCRTHELKLQGLKYELVEAVDNYIQYVGPGSCLNGLVLVEACELYGVDLKFALAQGHIESHFGTKGIAAKTNSVFNVGSWDGVSADKINRDGRGYSHPDRSVEPYLEKLKTSYLVGKTEMDMFKKFTNTKGQRYASNPNYEHQLKRIYDNIDSVCNISKTYNEYKQYKEFLHK